MPNLIETIAKSVLYARHQPKALIAAVKEKHPEATKSDIVRAAFYAVISNADADPAKSDRLQAMAIAGRGGDSAEAKKTSGPKKARASRTKVAESGKAD